MRQSPFYFKSEAPEGRSGEWIVERFQVRENDGYDPEKDERPHFARRRPGQYTQLRRGGQLFMTDLYDEWWTQKSAIDQARRRGNHVLITGLGLGMIVESLLRDPRSRVQQITVVELSPDVITLVGVHLQKRYGDKLNIVNADAFRWTPPADSRFAVGWHDIWPHPYGEAVRMEELSLLRRYRQCCDWQGCWPSEYLACFGSGNSEPDGPDPKLGE